MLYVKIIMYSTDAFVLPGQKLYMIYNAWESLYHMRTTKALTGICIPAILFEASPGSRHKAHVAHCSRCIVCTDINRKSCATFRVGPSLTGSV